MTVDRETRFRMSGEKPHAENNGTQGGCCKSLVPAPPHIAALRAVRGGESVLQEEAWRPSARCGPVTRCVCHLLQAQGFQRQGGGTSSQRVTNPLSFSFLSTPVLLV